MNRYRIEHNKTKRSVIITALSFEDSKTQFVFYCDLGGKIVECSYNKYIWDIVVIDYNNNIDKNEG